MKITQVMLSSGYGGAERLFVDMCLELAALGHRVQAVCHPEFQEMEQIIHPNIIISPLNVHWDWSPWARYRMQSAIKKFAPCVIHSHLARGAAIAGPVGAALGIPVVANMHNYVKLKYYRQVSHFCPGTVDQKRHLISQGIPPKHITVIPHFSRISAVNKLDVSLQPSASPTFLSYGRFVEKKGFHHLIKSIAQLRKTEVDAKLVLWGDGPEKSSLERLIADLGLTPHIRLSGWVNDVAAFLTQSPYVVIPSLDEPFGIVVLEAMAQGKVIICSKTKGPMEILNDSTAFLFETGNVEDLTRTMIIAVNESTKSESKTRNALKTYHETYSPKKIIPKYVALFNMLGRIKGSS